jgi:glycolate oxidase
MYPPDPASIDLCSIGGNVSENAGGPKAVKYGTTKDYITGIEYVLADGSIIQSGGKFVKNSTGYNIIGIITGSEGTLAVITKIYLRLIPAPRVVRDILIPFSSLDEAINMVCTILHSRIVPACIEFMESDTIAIVSKYFKGKVPFPDSGAQLLIQVDGCCEASVFEELEMISGIPGIKPENMLIAQSPSQQQRLWKIRRSIRESICSESPVFFAEDTVVPISKIPQFLSGLKEYFNSRNLRSVMFGHAGDGNVHIDILKDKIEYKKWSSMIPEIKKEIYNRAISLGGTITGEHGIGYLRRDYIGMALSSSEIDLSRRIKSAFDPKGILNPGKIF